MFTVGTAFINSLLIKLQIQLITINKIDILRQKWHIDIVIKVEANLGNYAIIIEDKIHAMDYNDLKKYIKDVEPGLPSYKALGLLVKTGDQSNYANVVGSNFKIYNIEDFVHFFNTYSINCIKNNNILIDFYKTLEKRQNSIDLFRSLPIGDWAKKIGLKRELVG